MTNYKQETPVNTGLRLYLDSADPALWQRLLPLGIFYGVTTNPLLLERADQACTLVNLKSLTTQAANLGCREIHLQAWGENSAEFISCGQELAELATSSLAVAVKLPATTQGFLAAKVLSDQKFNITITAVYNESQVLAAASLGAAYAAPYLGRIIDAGRDGRHIVLNMNRILKKTGSRLRLLTASLRSVEQIVDMAAEGLDTFTFGSAVADQLLNEDLTEKAAADFQRAAITMGDTQ